MRKVICLLLLGLLLVLGQACFLSTFEEKAVQLVYDTIAAEKNGKKVRIDCLFKKIPNPFGVSVTLKNGDTLVATHGLYNETEKTLAEAIVATTKELMKNTRLENIKETSDDFNVEISILSPFIEIPFKTKRGLIETVKVGEGVLLKSDTKSVIFLPHVWQKNMFPHKFVNRLFSEGRFTRKEVSMGRVKAYRFLEQKIKENEKIQKWRMHQKKMAINALKGMVQPDGKIQYARDYKYPDEIIDGTEVRLMGTAYSIAYALYIEKDKELIPVLQKVFRHYADKINEPEINTGAKALMLLAIIYYEQATQDVEFNELRDNLTQGLDDLYMPNVGFKINMEIPATSPYYDGESWLALATYVHFYPNDKTMMALIENIDETMLEKFNPQDFNNQFFHWGMQSAAARFKDTDDERFLEYMKVMTDAYIKQGYIPDSSAVCAYMEGLTAAADAVQQADTDFYNRLQKHTKAHLENVSSLQILDKIPNSNRLLPDGLSQFNGAFLLGKHSSQIRCDATQHCIVALLKYQE